MPNTGPREGSEPIPPPLFSFAALLDDFAADATRRHEALSAGLPLGAVSGLPKLDELLGGAFPPGLSILHGSPGVGKTAFVLQAAASCRCPALYVTCEMAPIELLRRHTARVTETFLGRFKTGELSSEAAVSLAKRAAKLAPFLAILDATQVPATAAHVLNAAENTRRLTESPHLLIIVDSLHSWADGQEDSGDEYERLNAALAALRIVGKRTDASVLAISERNRAGMKNGGQSAGAGTRKIEYGAECVLELHKDDKTEKDAAGEIDCELRISKNRNGAAGKPISLRFNGALQRFTEDVF